MKNKTNISILDNVGVRRNASIEVGANGNNESGLILDANAVESLISDKIDSVHSPDIQSLRSGITANTANIQAVAEKIPTQATSNNQLADKDFVNSSISTNTADFKGTYDISTDLSDDISNLSDAITNAEYSAPNNNDYCFIINEDNDGNTVYDRYKYTVINNSGSWDFEYSLNNSSFTAAQWEAISSGITSSIVSELNNLTHSTIVRNIVVLTQAEFDALSTKDPNTEYNII